MCTGGAYRPFLHDRHFNAASSFHIGVSRDCRIASSGTLARVLQRLHSTSRPAEAAVQALRDRRRRLRRTTVAFHAKRPRIGFRAICFASGFYAALAGTFCVDLRCADAATPDNLTDFVLLMAGHYIDKCRCLQRH